MMTKEEMYHKFRAQTQCGYNNETVPCQACDDEASRMVAIAMEIQDDAYNEALQDVLKNAKVDTRKAIFMEGEWDEPYLVKESITKLMK